MARRETGIDQSNWSTVEASDRALFDTIAMDYARKDVIPYCRLARRLRLERTIEGVAEPIQNLLEVGCGAGFSAEYLAGRFRKYVGVDYSEKLIDLAKGHHGSSGNEFVCTNIKEFDTDRKFDLILMIGVLHHVTEPEDLLVDLTKFLAPGGVVAVNEPMRGNPLIKLMRKVRKIVDPNYSADQIEFTEQEVRELFVRSGYQVECFPQGVLSTPFAETSFLPNFIGFPLSWLIVRLDPILDRLLAMIGLRQLAWNIVVQAKPVKQG